MRLPGKLSSGTENLLPAERPEWQIRVYAALGRNGAAMRCGAGTDRAGFTLANGARFKASSRRSSERVPPVIRASSGSFGSENPFAGRKDGDGFRS